MGTWVLINAGWYERLDRDAAPKLQSLLRRKFHAAQPFLFRKRNEVCSEARAPGKGRSASAEQQDQDTRDDEGDAADLEPGGAFAEDNVGGDEGEHQLDPAERAHVAPAINPP